MKRGPMTGQGQAGCNLSSGLEMDYAKTGLPVPASICRFWRPQFAFVSAVNHSNLVILIRSIVTHGMFVLASRSQTPKTDIPLESLNQMRREFRYWCVAVFFWASALGSAHDWFLLDCAKRLRMSHVLLFVDRPPARPIGSGGFRQTQIYTRSHPFAMHANTLCFSLPFLVLLSGTPWTSASVARISSATI